MKRVTEKKLARWSKQAESLLRRAHALTDEIEATVEEDSLLLEYSRAATIALDEFVTVAGHLSTFLKFDWFSGGPSDNELIALRFARLRAIIKLVQAVEKQCQRLRLKSRILMVGRYYSMRTLPTSRLKASKCLRPF
jgi:hypothetical protein